MQLATCTIKQAWPHEDDLSASWKLHAAAEDKVQGETWPTDLALTHLSDQDKLC